MRLLGVLFLPAALAFAITYSATRVVDVPQHKPPQATSIVWADRVFETKRDLARWLRARGVNYRVWALRHPAALGREVPKAQPAAEPAHAEDSSSDKGTILIVGAVAAALLGSLIFLVRGRGRSGPVLHAFGRATIARVRLLRARTVLLVRGSGAALSSCGRGLRVFGQAAMASARLVGARTVMLVRGSGAAFSSCGRAVKAARVVYHQQSGLPWYVSGLALLLATCVLVAARM